MGQNQGEPLRKRRRRNLGPVQVNMGFIFTFTKQRKEKEKSVLGLLNLGKVLATTHVLDGGFSGYFSFARMISLCICRLCILLIIES